jgi:predicted kinase
MTDSPKLFMLVGLPGTGKSTWIKQNGFLEKSDWAILSTDKYIDRAAAYAGKTYNEVFKNNIRRAEGLMHEDLDWALEQNRNIIWDQTNLSVATRAKKLRLIPDHYKKYAVVFLPPENHDKWLNSPKRVGKTIPANIMASMKATYQEPVFSEGFEGVFLPSSRYLQKIL